MLDEIKEFKQLTEPNDKNNPWRLRDKNLKKNLSGLSRELEILARGFLFGYEEEKKTELEDHDYQCAEQFIKSWLGHSNKTLNDDVLSINNKLPNYLLEKKTEARDKAVEAVSENKKWYFVYQAEEKTFNMVSESSIKDVYAKELSDLKDSNGKYIYVQYKKSLKKYDKIYKKLKKEGKIQNKELKENYDAYFGNNKSQECFKKHLNDKNLYEFFKTKLYEKDWKEFLELCQKIDKMPYCKTFEIKPNINGRETKFTCVVQVGRETTKEELDGIKLKLKEKFEKPCDICFEAVKKDGKNVNKCQDRREVIHCLFDDKGENNKQKNYVNDCTCKYFEDLGRETFGYHTCINSLAKAKSKFSKRMFNDSLKDNSFAVDNSIKYQKIISNALRNGPLKERFLYSSKEKKKDLFYNVKKAKNSEDKIAETNDDKNDKISEKDKNKILMLVAYYLIKCQENNYKENNHFVVLNKSDFSNWIGANFESSNVTAGQTYLDRFTYSASDSVSKLFEYKNLASKITKFKINKTWLSECGFGLKEKIENVDTGTYYKDTGRKLEIIKQGDINGNINE